MPLLAACLAVLLAQAPVDEPLQSVDSVDAPGSGGAPATVRHSAPSLERVWTTAIGAARGTGIEAIFPAGELVLAADAAHGVTAIGAADGRVRWFVQHSGPLDVPPGVGPGTVSLASLDHVIVVDASSGTRLFDGGAEAVPALRPIADRRGLYVPAVREHRVVARRLQNGQQVWHIALPAPLVGDALLVDELLVVGCADGTLRAVTATVSGAGRQAWVAEVDELLGGPVAAGGRVLAAGRDRRVRALEASSGRTIWKHVADQELLGSPATAGDVVAVRGRRELLGLSADRGRLLWRAEAAIPRGEAGGLLLVTRSNGSSALLDPATGRAVAEGLPGELLAVDGALVDVGDPATLAGLRLAR